MSRRPTWLLFVLFFVVGSAVLVAGVIAVAVVVGAIAGELEDSIAASATTSATNTNSTTTVTTVPGGTGSGLSIGECIDDGEVENYIAGVKFETTSCDRPHDNEVFYIHVFSAGPYPGEDAIRDTLAAECVDTFERYVGRDYETSALVVYPVWPGRELWESGERIGECLLYDTDLDKLTGSAYQSGW